MPRPDSSSKPRPLTAREGLAALLSVAAFLAGLACVAVALVGIIGARPGPVAMASVQKPELATLSGDAAPVGYLDALLDAAPDDSAGSVEADAQTQRGESRPARGAVLGALVIPALGRALPIIEGTGAAELSRGVGHYRRSALPGASNNCVLSGHRDTVFAGLGKVGVGALLIVQTPAGEFTYKVREVRIVDKDDQSVIVPTGYAVLTVTTCYPFSFFGTAPDRYVLVADLVDGR